MKIVCNRLLEISISKYLMCLGFFFCFSCTDVDVVENRLEETEDIRFGLTLADGWKELDHSRSSSEGVKHAMQKFENSEWCLYTAVEPGIKHPVKETDSRATTTTTATMSDYGVFSYLTQTGGTEQQFMNNTQVDVSDNHTYSPLKYWPNNFPESMSFYAYMPYSHQNLSVATTSNQPTLTYTVSTEITEQADLLSTEYLINNDNFKKKVDLEFKHILTAVKIKNASQSNSLNKPIRKVVIENVHDKGTFDVREQKWKGQTGNQTYTCKFPIDQLEGNFKDGYVYENTHEIIFMMMPQTLGDNARIVVYFEGGTSIQASLKGTTWGQGQTVSYTITQEEIKPQYFVEANSYIVNPISADNGQNLFAVPVTNRINTFWRNEGGDPNFDIKSMYWEAVVIWQDQPERVIHFTDALGDNPTDVYQHQANGDDYFYFKLANEYFTKTTNVLVGIRLSSDSGTYLWSWHLWITPYNPIPTQAVTADGHIFPAKNGYVHRYDDPGETETPLWNGVGAYNDPAIYMMDRNLGAASASKEDGSATWGLYYQYGRKDPFLPWTYPTNPTIVYNKYYPEGLFYYGIQGNAGNPLGWGFMDSSYRDVDDTNPDNYFVLSVENPLIFYYPAEKKDGLYKSIPETPGKISWAAPENVERVAGHKWFNPDWNGGAKSKKSFYDPCPPGWKVPAAHTWDLFRKNQGTANSTDYDPNAANFNPEDDKGENFNTKKDQAGWDFYIDKDGGGYTAFYPAAGNKQKWEGPFNVYQTYGYFLGESDVEGPYASSIYFGWSIYSSGSQHPGYPATNMDGGFMSIANSGTNSAFGFSIRCVRYKP